MEFLCVWRLAGSRSLARQLVTLVSYPSSTILFKNLSIYDIGAEPTTVSAHALLICNGEASLLSDITELELNAVVTANPTSATCLAARVDAARVQRVVMLAARAEDCGIGEARDVDAWHVEPIAHSVNKHRRGEPQVGADNGCREPRASDWPAHR